MSVDPVLKKITLQDYAILKRRRNPLGTIHRGRLIVESVILIVLVVLFNQFAAMMGILIDTGKPAPLVPVLATGFADYLPWLNLWLGLALGLNIIVLINGRWQPALKWVDLGLSVLGLAILASMVIGGPLLALNPEWAAGQLAAGVSIDQAQSWIPIWAFLAKSALVFAFVALVAASLRKLYLNLQSRSW